MIPSVALRVIPLLNIIRSLANQNASGILSYCALYFYLFSSFFLNNCVGMTN
jgi:hypothetical protein